MPVPRLLRPFASGLPCAVLVGAAALLSIAPAGGGPGTLAFWRVSDPRQPAASAVFVLAAVPVRDTTLLRFDRAIATAFDSSARLVLANDSVLGPQNALVGGKARLPDGVTLRDRTSASLYARYAAAIGRGGFAPGTGDVTAAWFGTRVVESADLRGAGFVDAHEVERYFATLARERPEKIAIVPLEPASETYDRYAALSTPMQAELLEAALDASERGPERLAAASQAWHRGDEPALARALEGGPARAAAKRTRAAETAVLAGGVSELLAGPKAGGPSFLVADARQVVGPDGLLALLRARGLEVRQAAATGEVARARPASTVAAPPRAATSGAGRVLLVGIDGATLRVLTPLLAAGRAPFLARLASEGASGPLRSHRPLYSPRIWNSVATGKRPEKHGIEGFTFRDASGKERLFLSEHRRAHALWNIVSKAGRTVGVVNWWNTYPPEVVRGVMVSDHAKPTRLAELRRLAGLEQMDGAASRSDSVAAAPTPGATVFPASWSEPVAAIHADARGLTAFDDPFLGNVGLPRWAQKEELSRRYHEDAAATRIALAVESELRPDLLMVFLPGIDRVSHRIWGSLEPDHPYPPHLQMRPREREAARDALFAYYEYTDALLALLARAFGPEDLVVVLSDHGFEPGVHLGGLTGIHDSERAIDGVLFARGPGIRARSDTRGTSVDDIAPTVLAWLGLPVGRDMDGKPAAFLRGRAPTTIATHDTEPVERLAAGPSGSEEEILEQLRALGYLE